MSARVGVDVGGTFTDLVAIAPDGAIAVRKVASTPADPAQGVFRAIESLGMGDGGRGKGKADSVAISTLVHGTTVATNALLERRGARIVFVTTRGFEDLLWLRRQDRAALYDLAADHPPPLVAREDCLGVAERTGPDGILEPLTDAEVARVVNTVRERRPQAVAVGLLFGFRHPAHERRLAEALRAALPGVPVAAAHEVLPVFREYERFSTTSAEAYLRPAVSSYLQRLSGSGAPRHVAAWRIMTSSGGTLSPEAASCRAASLALSGPAGGVVGAGLIGAAAGCDDLLTLDMGGTSADASLIVGGSAVAEGSGMVAGVPLALPATLIETVSAGGGSVAWIDEGGALRVGPRSAGAIPGPACYGRGGTAPTVTDACLVLGWLDAAHPLADDVRLDRAAADRAVATLGMAAAAAADGIVAVAVAVMARALKRVSVSRGVDPRGMTLLPFGGAGPLFGCALADALGMARVVIPPHPGVLSALGLAAAAERVELLAPLHRQCASLTAADLAAGFQPIQDQAEAQLPQARYTRYADCRFEGQGYEVTVPSPSEDPAAIARAFVAAHRARYGSGDADGAVEIVTLRVVAERVVPPPRLTARRDGADKPGSRTITVRGAKVRAAVWPLDGLTAGTAFAGPAILAGPDATALIEPGWRAAVHASGAVIVERGDGPP